MSNRLHCLLLLLISAWLLACTGNPSPDRGSLAHTPIHAIQGAGHHSPLEGQVVSTRGVVTLVEEEAAADGKRAADGKMAEGSSMAWLQSLDTDGDDATSQALQLVIDSNSFTSRLRPGQLVAVEGMVAEIAQPGELSVTSLRVQRVTVESSEQPLPAPIVLGRGGRMIPDSVIDDDQLTDFEPDADGLDFFESLEGMFVEVPFPIVVGGTTSRDSFAVLADGGRDAAPRSRRGGIVVTETDANPERIHVSMPAGQAPLVDVGDAFSAPILGILEYRFGQYRIWPRRLPSVLPGLPVGEQTLLRSGAKSLTAATLNVLNLAATDDTVKFKRIASIIARQLAAPDLIALQEVQDDNGIDDDGTTSAAQTLKRLIEAIQAAGGPLYESHQIDPTDRADGGRPGTNIRTAFLVNPQRVEVLGMERLEAVANSEVDSPSADTFHNTRKPLALRYRFADRQLLAVNLHLSSKRGDDRPHGPTQPPVAHTQVKRQAQARAVVGWIAELRQNHAVDGVTVLGDMNEHEFRPPMQTLSDSGLVNLIAQVPIEDRYTYIYQGNSQVLDQIFVDQALHDATRPEVDIVHVNADLAAARQASDHDPIVLRLNF